MLDVRELTGYLPKIMDAYELLDSFIPSIKDQTVVQKCAVIDLKERKDSNSFFESMADTRGYNLRPFLDIDKAMKWLQD